MKKIYVLSMLTFISYLGFSQCAPGEASVSIIVNTDTYGYEGYWELVPAGNACGTGTIASGGNTAVGCNGAGAQNQTPGGYANNLQVNEGPYCLILGNQYDLIYTDDWGDGGFTFDITVNGYAITSFDGIGLGATFTFTVEEPAPYDLITSNANLYSYVNIGTFDLEAHVFNNGTTTITSYDFNYSINGGAAVTHNVTGTNLTNYTDEMVVHSTPINITSNGIYDIKIWADNLNNGNLDADNSNDTIYKQVEAGPGIPNNIDAYIGAATAMNQIAGSGNSVNSPTDLDFHPVLSNMELWVTNKGTENSGGSTVTIFNAGETNQTSIYKQDGNAWHFMSLPTGIAFSQNGNWANSPGVYDANHNGGGAFTGPALWSSDMTIYAEPSGGNGSHLDMLHASPYCQGIAAEKDNVFWVFDGYSQDIVRYDFVEDHGPGNDYHGDAIIRRYSDDQVTRDATGTVVSHLVLDENKQWLYTVDHGNQRVIRIDITTGSNMGTTPLYTSNEPVAEYSAITGYTQELVISGLTKPAGIDVIEDRLIVSENNSGEIIIYDISSMPALELGRIQTGFNSVQGIKIGPDGNIWFVDQNTNGVYRADITSLASTNVEELTVFNIYPNPSNGKFNIRSNDAIGASIEIKNMLGATVLKQNINASNTEIELDVQPGVYIASMIKDGKMLANKKVVIQ